MASTIDICNLALMRIGQRGNLASIDPSESGSPLSEACNNFFDIVKNDFLEAFPWSFAVRRAALSKLAAAPLGYSAAYRLPSDCIRVVQLLYSQEDAGYIDRLVHRCAQRRLDQAEWDVELVDGIPALLTDAAPDAVRYISTKADVNRFSPLAADALSWLLASHLAGYVLQGDAGMQQAQKCMQFYSATVDSAIKADQERQKKRPHYTTPFVEDYWNSYEGAGDERVLPR